jgi:hypothetical protein
VHLDLFSPSVRSHLASPPPCSSSSVPASLCPKSPPHSQTLPHAVLPLGRRGEPARNHAVCSPPAIVPPAPPPEPPKEPDAMQHDVDRQMSRYGTSLRASPSPLQCNSAPFLSSLGPFPGPRFTFSGRSRSSLTFNSHPCPRLPSARAHVCSPTVRVPILVRPLDFEPALRLRRRRILYTSPEHLLRRLLARHA